METLLILILTNLFYNHGSKIPENFIKFWYWLHYGLDFFFSLLYYCCVLFSESHLVRCKALWKKIRWMLESWYFRLWFLFSIFEHLSHSKRWSTPLTKGYEESNYVFSFYLSFQTSFPFLKYHSSKSGDLTVSKSNNGDDDGFHLNTANIQKFSGCAGQSMGSTLEVCKLTKWW